MVEKKQIVYDLTLKYTGPLSVPDFYKEVEDWMKEKGLHKDLKKKSEDITPNGKKIEWVIECWKSLPNPYKHMVKMRVLFNEVKQIKVKKSGNNIRINHAKVLIIIDGWIESKFEGRWTQAPLHQFFRTLYDKYVWKIANKYDNGVEVDCYDLHKRLKAFFHLYKMKVS